MYEIAVVNNGIRIEGTYEVISPTLVRVILTAPYQVVMSLLDANNEYNFFSRQQAYGFIKSKLRLLALQFKNMQRYETIYREACKSYYTKVKTMHETVSTMDFNNVRGARFRYETEKLSQYELEFNAEIRAKIAEVTDENQEQFLIYPYILEQIFYETKI